MVKTQLRRGMNQRPYMLKQKAKRPGLKRTRMGHEKGARLVMFRGVKIGSLSLRVTGRVASYKGRL